MKKKQTKPASAVSFQVWNMNGGPLPQDVVDSVTEYIQGLVEVSDNPRLLMSVNKT